MSSLTILFLGLILFILGYLAVGKKLEKLWEVHKENKTPAYTNFDGIDYVPAKHWLILFGHHFASIAGAGPILGPVVAVVLWGWMPAVLWIVLGTLFIGGVHDFSALLLSIRHNGRSITDIASSAISERAKVVFAIFVWLALILVIAVFAAVTAKTFLTEPKIVIPTFGLIGIAILFGLLVYRLGVNYLLATILSLIILFVLLYFGYAIPLSLALSQNNWILILLIYSFLASIIPVNILLQPRDYISAFILFFGLISGYIGLFLTRPLINAPAVISFSSNSGYLWPMMCVMIACGAISGFHSLVASGTTSKQIANEMESKKIAYGGMILEGLLAILALLTVSAGLYWYGPDHDLNYPALMQKGDWIVTFGKGFGRITSPLFGTSLGTLIATLLVNSFVLTTLDTATRINRYITQEIFGAKIRIFKNRVFSTFIVVLLAYWLATGNWKAIWPVFGSANQLVAGLAFFVILSYLFIKKKKKSFLIIIPAIFMFITTVMALLYQMPNFFSKKDYLLGMISAVLVILALFVLSETIRKVKRTQ